jgi:hypothetical protein
MAVMMSSRDRARVGDLHAHCDCCDPVRGRSGGRKVQRRRNKRAERRQWRRPGVEPGGGRGRQIGAGPSQRERHEHRAGARA